jgi:hypothetical protein
LLVVALVVMVVVVLEVLEQEHLYLLQRERHIQLLLVVAVQMQLTQL